MKPFLIFFLIFFVIFFYIGCESAKKDVANPNFLRKHTFSKASIIPLENSYYLAFKKDTSILYIFNVDSNKLIKIDRSALVHLNSATIPDKPLLTYLQSSAPAFLGAGALGFTIKDLFANAKGLKEELRSSKGRGTIAGIILGSISGYSAGYWFGTANQIPSENSKEVAGILTADSNWTFAKKEIYLNNYSSCRFMAGKIENKTLGSFYSFKLDSCFDEIILKPRKYRFTSSDFKFLFAVRKVIEPIYAKQKDKPTIVDTVFKIFLITLVSALVCWLIYSLLIEKFIEKRKIEKLNKNGLPKNITEAILRLDKYTSIKAKLKFRKYSEEYFLKQEEYRLGSTIYDAWDVGWHSHEEKQKAISPKPEIVSFFESYGIEYGYRIRDIILRSFYRSLSNTDIQFENQVATILQEEKERKEKYSKTPKFKNTNENQ